MSLSVNEVIEPQFKGEGVEPQFKGEGVEPQFRLIYFVSWNRPVRYL